MQYQMSQEPRLPDSDREVWRGCSWRNLPGSVEGGMAAEVEGPALDLVAKDEDCPEGRPCANV